MVSGTLQNNGDDFGGVQLTTASNPCQVGTRGSQFPQDLDIRVDLMVPETRSVHTDAGPYFRSRAAAPGDGVFGGTSSGYWVELVSTGQVRVTQMNPMAVIATSTAPPAFDSTVVHTLEMVGQGAGLQVSPGWRGAAVLLAKRLLDHNRRDFNRGQ